MQCCRNTYGFLLCTVVLGACVGPDLPPFRIESEHFRLSAREDIQICPGVIEWLEYHYAVVTDFLGVASANNFGANIYVFRDLEDLKANGCGDRGRIEFTACYRSGDVFVTGSPYNSHELIHAYARNLGRPPEFFVEGLAVLLAGSLWTKGWTIPRSEEVLNRMTTDGFFGLGESDLVQAYVQAAGFSRFLIDQFGREAFLRFYAETPHDAGLSEIKTLFGRIFGESLERSVSAWVDGPEQTMSGIQLYPAECAMPPIGNVGDRVTMSCENAVDPSNLGEPFIAIRTFELADRSPVRLGVASPSRPVHARVFGCEREVPVELRTPGATFEGGPNELWTTLPRGRYWLFASSPRIEGEALDQKFVSNIWAEPRPNLFEKQAAVDIDPSLHRLEIRPSPDGQACADNPCGLEVDFRVAVPKRAQIKFDKMVERFWICPREDEVEDGSEKETCLPRTTSTATVEDFFDPGQIYRLGWSQPSGQDTRVVLELEDR